MQGERIFVFSLQRNFGEQISNGAKKVVKSERGRREGRGSCRMQNEDGQHGKRGVVDESGL